MILLLLKRLLSEAVSPLIGLCKERACARRFQQLNLGDRHAFDSRDALIG